MAGTERDPRAVWVYERTLGEVAERRVVDEAETVLARAWVGELERARTAARGQIAATRVAELAAFEKLRAAQNAGRPAELARAHARLAALQDEQASALDSTRALIERLDAEIERAGLADVERSRRAQLDLARLRDAWTGAYGSAPPRHYG